MYNRISGKYILYTCAIISVIVIFLYIFKFNHTSNSFSVLYIFIAPPLSLAILTISYVSSRRQFARFIVSSLASLAVMFASGQIIYYTSDRALMGFVILVFLIQTGVYFLASLAGIWLRFKLR